MKKSFSFYFDILSILVLIAGIVLSRFLMNLGMGMLVFRLFFIGSFKDKFENIKSQKAILITILSFFILHLLGLLWTDNIRFGLDEIVRKIAFLIIPITILAISPLPKQTLKYAFWGFVLAIFVGTVWGSIVYFSDPYVDIRNLIKSTSHIRFSLSLAFAILVLLKVNIVDRKRLKLVFRIGGYILSLWFLFYLILTQAITGIVILSIFLLFYIPYYSIKNKQRKSTILVFTIYFVSILVSFVWVSKEYNFYFTPNKIYENKLVEKTPDGGSYIHFIGNKHIENGNYLYLYYCKQEVNQEWEKRTGLEAEEYADVIVRYMNSVSPYKDGKRFRELTDNDIENIKNQIGNKAYTEKLSLRPRLYSIFLQINSYQVNGSVRGSSEMQRLELWRNALALIQDNFFIGSGTGDIVDDFGDKLCQRESDLSGTSLKAHNQYLYVFASFGLLGFLLFVFWLIYPPFKLGLFDNYIYIVFFYIIAISMITEDTLDNLAGIMFFIFINSILLFNSKTIKAFLPKKNLL